MTIAYLLELCDNKGPGTRLEEKQLAGLTARLPGLPHITGLNVYTPLEEKSVDKLLIQVLLDGEQCLTRMLATNEFADVYSQLNRLLNHDTVLTQQAMLLETFLSPEKGIGQNSIAHISMYCGPVPDEKQFILDYRNIQAPAMLKLPGVKRVDVGLAVRYQYAPAITQANRILFCETDFENLQQLKAARVPESYRALQKDTGNIRTLIMRRQTLVY